MLLVRKQRSEDGVVWAPRSEQSHLRSGRHVPVLVDAADVLLESGVRSLWSILSNNNQQAGLLYCYCSGREDSFPSHLAWVEAHRNDDKKLGKRWDRTTSGSKVVHDKRQSRTTMIMQAVCGSSNKRRFKPALAGRTCQVRPGECTVSWVEFVPHKLAPPKLGKLLCTTYVLHR